MLADLNISHPDIVVIVVYISFIILVGCGSGWWHRRKVHKTMVQEQGGYFLAGKLLTWPLIGLALFSTNISTIHLVLLAEEGYKNELVYGNTEWLASFSLIILAIFFVPFYLKAKVATLPEFLERRYSKASRN